MSAGYALRSSRTKLDIEQLAAVDRTNQLSAVVAMGGHVREALARVDASPFAAMDAPGGVIVAGMGGSAAGARLAVAALGSRLHRPMLVESGYTLPGWVGPQTLVLCSSYSGNTEETLAAYDDAGRRGAPRVVAATGGELTRRALADDVPVITLPEGFQPRAAIGYAVTVALEVAALAGCGPSLRDEILSAADLIERLVPLGLRPALVG